MANANTNVITLADLMIHIGVSDQQNRNGDKNQVETNDLLHTAGWSRDVDI